MPLGGRRRERRARFGKVRPCQAVPKEGCWGWAHLAWQGLGAAGDQQDPGPARAAANAAVTPHTQEKVLQDRGGCASQVERLG